MRHILIAVSGTAPQIVTETIWWMAKRADPPVQFERIHVVTTSSAKARAAILMDDNGAIQRLARELGCPVPKIEIHVFNDRESRPLHDIRSSADSQIFSASITELVRRITMDPDIAVHASLAGGRKTMGFHLGQAMSLLGRPQDRLSHVLVPAEFEDCDGFWYPTSVPTSLVGRDGSRLDASQASVELTDVPFVRLRGQMTARELQSAISNTAPLVQRIQTVVDDPACEVQTTLEIDGIVARADASKNEGNPARPLAPVLSALHPDAKLTMRIRMDPGADRVVRFFLNCRGSGSSVERARSAAYALAADLRHSLSDERSGYRLISSSGDSVTGRYDWNVALVPVEGILLDASKPALSEVSASDETRGVNIGRLEGRSGGPRFPLHALATSDSALELSWSVERMHLESQVRETLLKIGESLAVAEHTSTGDVKSTGRAVMSGAEAGRILRALEGWRHHPAGFRLQLTVRAQEPVPNALLAQIGAAAWGGRQFVVRGENDNEQIDPAIFDLSHCFCSDSLPPFELPTPLEFRAAGFPVAWPGAQSNLSTTGSRIGRSGGRPVRLSDDDRARHVYSIGSTGTGKSTLLRNMILQDIEAGKGVFLLDPHGDLFDEVLNNIPSSRQDSVILLDAGDVEHPFGLNFLELDPANPEMSAGFAINEILAIFFRLYENVPEAFGPMFEQYFRLVMTLLVNNRSLPDANLLDVSRVFSDAAFREMLRKGVRSPAVADLMTMAMRTDGDLSWENVAPYIVAKFSRLVLNPLMRNICCQSRSTINFRQAMDEGRIVLARLPKGRLSEIDVRLLGMLLIGKLFGAALGRDNASRDDRRAMHVYIDEFQNFVTETAGQMMAEARKYGLNLTLANQTLAQLDPKMKEIVLGNAANLLAFRTGPADAETLRRFFEPSLTANDLQVLPNFRCAARILFGGTPVTPPFVLETDAPLQSESDRANLDLLIDRSRRLYARARGTVESELESRRGRVGETGA